MKTGRERSIETRRDSSNKPAVERSDTAGTLLRKQVLTETTFGRRPSVTVAWGKRSAAPRTNHPMARLTKSHIHDNLKSRAPLHQHLGEYGRWPKRPPAYRVPVALPQATVKQGLRPKYRSCFCVLPKNDSAHARVRTTVYRITKKSQRIMGHGRRGARINYQRPQLPNFGSAALPFCRSLPGGGRKSHLAIYFQSATFTF
jgi:hypothetical protein